MGHPSKPCRRCGGPKDRGVRGAQFCQACHIDMGPIWQQRESDRARKRGRETRKAAGVPQRAKKINEHGDVWCARCADYLPKNRFTIFKTGKNAGRPSAYCRRCNKAYAHERRLKNLYGMDADEYDRLLRIQGGRCAICRAKPIKFNLAVDHDHKTGKVRGLLCKRCNHELLGAARDSTEMLERAVCYLESPPADTGLSVVVHEDFERDAAIIRRFGNKWAVIMEIDQLAELLSETSISFDDIHMHSTEPIPEHFLSLLREATSPPPDGHVMRNLTEDDNGWWVHCECGEELYGPYQHTAVDNWHAHRDEEQL